MRTVCRLFPVLLLMTTGCTYNPVRFDPVSGFQSGGGVGVLCGGPLDPWMHHCCPECGCSGPCGCESVCAPVCAPVCTPVCAPMCAPVCPPPVCAPGCPPVGMPWGTLPTMPAAGPGAFGAPPVPTFAPSCPTCGPTPSGMPGTPYGMGGPYPGATNYSQLFHAPGMAPPVGNSGEQFLMPTPLDASEIPRVNAPMPPHYDDMDTPTGQQPTPATMPPMNPAAPMPQAAPMNPQPTPMNAQPMPTPVGQEAMQQPSFPHIFGPPVSYQGADPGQRPYIDSRRHDANHMRL